MATNPTLITTPFAQSGDKTTPPNTNTPSDGRFSQTLGFPPVTAIPLGSGGKAPKREDFNGAFNMLSNIAFYAQKGWVFQWDSGQSYYAGCIVRYSGNLYACTSDVTSTTNPASDTSHWSQYKILPGVEYATKSDAGGGGYNARDTKTSSGSYSAPVTGWYKVTVKGGGGGGAGGRAESSVPSYSGGGGGEGGTTIAYVYMTAGTTASVVIGAGGSAGSASNNGGNGGNSTVTINSTTYTGGGGYGGSHSNRGGNGGSGTVQGAAGGSGFRVSSSYTSGGGTGGGNGGGLGGEVGATSGTAGTQGGGGGGGANGAFAGGAGGSGYAWFEYFDTSLNP